MREDMVCNGERVINALVIQDDVIEGDFILVSLLELFVEGSEILGASKVEPGLVATLSE